MTKFTLQDYTIVFRSEQPQSGGTIYTYEVAEIPGLIAEGGTPEAARARLEAVFAPAIAAMVRDNLPVPEPTAPTLRFLEGVFAQGSAKPAPARNSPHGELLAMA